MSDMRFPLKDHLVDPVDEAAVHKIALEIDARLPVKRRRRGLPLLVLGTAAAAAVTAVTVFSSRPRHDAGPLLLADGREVMATAAARAGWAMDLADGSRIWLAPGARLEPLESTGTKFSAIVRDGSAEFDIRPGGPRHWTIECGLATVEVMGTAFACERAPGRLRVVVRHGVVLVRGDRVPERARRLLAGQSLEIIERRDSGPPPPLEPPVARPADETPLASAETGLHEPASARASKSWRYLARHGRHREAFATLGSEGLRRESERLGVNDLLALADVARLSGHPAEAVMPLERILAEFSRDSQAPLAAFALGRLELDSLGHARAAAAAFRKALDLGMPRSLREDVMARLVEASARSGDAAAARRAADAYEREFPRGRHASAIRGWLEP